MLHLFSWRGTNWVTRPLDGNDQPAMLLYRLWPARDDPFSQAMNGAAKPVATHRELDPDAWTNSPAVDKPLAEWLPWRQGRSVAEPTQTVTSGARNTRGNGRPPINLPNWKVCDTLSDMESLSPPPGPHDARAELTAADQARDRLAVGLRLPSGLHPALAIAVGVQVGTAAVGIAQQTVAGLALVLAGLAVFLMTAALSLHRFRVINGVRVDGLASQVVLGSGTTSSLLYLGSFAAATWAAFESVWSLVAVAAVVGGAGYALGARRWWHAYRRDPVAHAGGASPRLLAGLAVIACLGLAALLVVG